MIRQPPAAGEWVLRGRAVHTAVGVRPAAVLIRGEKIAAVMGPDEAGAGLPLVDAGDRLVLPGLVETHAHINEPGRTEWEGFASATRAAAAGGVTTLIDMPLNSSPVTTTLEALRRKQRAADGLIMVDCGFHAGVVPGNAGQVEPLISAGVCGFKAFLCHSGIDEFPNATEADLRAVMPTLAANGIPLLAHAELVSSLPRAVEERFAAQPRSYAAYLATRPVEWEIAAIRLLLDLCREYRCRVHIVHLAAAEAARPLLAAARAERLPVTVETCPHYLYWAAEEITDGDTRFKCAPPIRDGRQRETLRDMVHRGEIDTLGSDHSPAPPALKHLDDGNLMLAWGGIASLQLLLPVAWTSLTREADAVLGQSDTQTRDSIHRIVDCLTGQPARLVGLYGQKGAIAPGFDADFVIFDPDAEFTVREDALEHRHKATPYNGRTLRGVVEATWLRGRKVFERGELVDKLGGRLVVRPR